VQRFDDRGDLGDAGPKRASRKCSKTARVARRWSTFGMKNGVITPRHVFLRADQKRDDSGRTGELEARRERVKRDAVGHRPAKDEDREEATFELAVQPDAQGEPVAPSVTTKEGGTGTRAKGEEGSMGSSAPTAKRMAVRGGAAPAPEPEAAPAPTLAAAPPRHAMPGGRRHAGRSLEVRSQWQRPAPPRLLPPLDKADSQDRSSAGRCAERSSSARLGLLDSEAPGGPLADKKPQAAWGRDDSQRLQRARQHVRRRERRRARRSVGSG
jgi:hypothetical protein